MRASFFILAITALVASAATIETRGLTDFPKCAVPCLLKANRGNCGMTDFHCLCHNSTFQNEAKACADKACHGGDIDKARAAQAKTCKGQ